jgi:hypothetical protein
LLTFLSNEKSQARLNDAVGQAGPAGQNNIKEPQVASRKLQVSGTKNNDNHDNHDNK